MLITRPMRPADVPACADLLNHIIALGGSTAHETPFDTARFTSHYLQGPSISNVVLSGDRIVGFQVASRHKNLPDDVLDIGTFTDRRDPVKGAGRALFEQTKTDAQALGARAITAHITADNSGGLGFYSRMGFVDIKVIPGDHIRKDGTPVDRVVKQFDLA